MKLPWGSQSSAAAALHVACWCQQPEALCAWPAPRKQAAAAGPRPPAPASLRSAAPRPQVRNEGRYGIAVRLGSRMHGQWRCLPARRPAPPAALAAPCTQPCCHSTCSSHGPTSPRSCSPYLPSVPSSRQDYQKYVQELKAAYPQIYVGAAGEGRGHASLCRICTAWRPAPPASDRSLHGTPPRRWAALHGLTGAPLPWARCRFLVQVKPTQFGVVDRNTLFVAFEGRATEHTPLFKARRRPRDPGGVCQHGEGLPAQCIPRRPRRRRRRCSLRPRA